MALCMTFSLLFVSVNAHSQEAVDPMDLVEEHYKQDTGLSAWFKDLFTPVDPRVLPEVTRKSPFNEIDDEYEARSSDPYNLRSLKAGADGEVNKERELSVPHRPDDVVGIWVQRAVSDVFSYTGGDYNQHLKLLRTGMTDQAIQEYDKVMHATNLLSNIQGGLYQVQASIDSKPDLLCRYVEDRRYRWLFDMTLTFTSRAKGSKGYEAGSEPETWSWAVILQVGRHARGGPHGIIIDHIAIRAVDEEWNRIKLLDPSNLPCSWDEVIEMVQ